MKKLGKKAKAHENSLSAYCSSGKSSITGTFSGYHISAMISLFIDELHDLQKLCNAMKEVFACPVSIKLYTR